jgi:SRSO17 transposase
LERVDFGIGSAAAGDEWSGIMAADVDWRVELERWLERFLVRLAHPARRAMCPLYVAGLIGPGDRKSVQPMAERLGLLSHDALHHFIAAGVWEAGPIETELMVVADGLVGGPDAYLVIDDTALPKKGGHSVGVAPQYASALGKNANCQTLVSLTISRGEVPVPVSLRLFLPESWTKDHERLIRAGVPQDHRAFRTKPEIALAEIDRVMAAGVRFGAVLADAGYGMSAAFRQGLSARTLFWAVGIPRHLKVYPATVALIPPDQSRSQRRLHTPDQLSVPAAEMLAGSEWQDIRWRSGTKGSLSARFAAMRIRVADGPAQQIGDKPAQHLPGEEVWVVGELRNSGEKKYYLSNLPADADLRALATAIKARWVCEQAHQQLKEELGLDHFEGRSWTGLHRHALMTMIACAFLQARRLGFARRGKKRRRTATPAQPAGGARRHRQPTHASSSATALPALPTLPHRAVAPAQSAKVVLP